MAPISVLIADDHAVVRTGLRMLLETQRDMEVVGEAGDGSDVSRKARKLKPDVVLLDLSMPGPPSGNVIRNVRLACPSARVLVLTMHDDPAYVASALSAGAAGYVVKKVADTELLSAIRAVHGGRTFVDVSQVADPTSQPAAGNTGTRRKVPTHLSRRELEVIRWLAEGHSNREIADGIGVSIKTVETYRTRVRKKLSLKGRAELYRFAVETGILNADSVDSREGRR